MVICDKGEATIEITMLVTRSVLIMVLGVLQTASMPLITWVDPEDLMMYQLVGSGGRSGDRSNKKQKNPIQNVKLHQILSGNIKSVEDMELLTEIALHEAEIEDHGKPYKSLREKLSPLRESESKDNVVKLNFTQVLNPDTYNDYPVYDENNPMLVFNVHLEYLANTFDKNTRKLLRDEFFTKHEDRNVNEKAYRFKLSKNSHNEDKLDVKNVDFVKELPKFNEVTDYDSNEEDILKAGVDDYKELYNLYNTNNIPEDIEPAKGDDDDAKPKRGFSLLTRWRPFSKPSHESWLRRPFFQAVLRHGDDMLTAEAQASSLIRPYGTPLRWG